MKSQAENKNTISFSLESEEKGLYYLIRIKGNFNAQALTQIRNTVEKAIEIGHIYLAFDLGKTTFIDSTGIGTLVNLCKTMKARGGDLYLIAIPPDIHESLSTTQIIKAIPNYKTIEEADLQIGS